MRSVTERGFVNYDEFGDSYGSTIIVRQSSAASEPKVWIFCQHPTHISAAPHLTVEQAQRLRDALGVFIAEQS